MIPPDAKVLIVDDDAGFRDSLARFFESMRIDVQTFASGAEFLAHEPEDGPTCVLLDLQMPELSGLQVQDELARIGREIPIVFLTGHGAISAGVQAMKRGAVDFLEKPFDERRVCEAVEAALAQSVQARRQDAAQLEARRRLARLTAREQQVCDYVMAGLLNKQSAYEIGIAESTVKVHRSRMMKKLGVSSLVQLIRLVDAVGGRLRLNGFGNGNGSSGRRPRIDEGPFADREGDEGLPQ
ncbi:MAG TPA: response regulator [Myxococcaceae bacterium]|nr:response regulator [Myxococcaceae bacterium]